MLNETLNLLSALEGLEPARPMDHHAGCCTVAKAWYVARHHALAGQEELYLDWVSRVLPWGPSVWPIAWCETMDESTGDCALHAAVAELVLNAAGLPVHRAQLVLGFEDTEILHWSRLWARARLAPTWLGNQVAYHEAIAVGEASIRIHSLVEAVEIADPALDRVFALRVEGPPTLRVEWAGREWTAGVWHTMESPSN